MSAAVKFGTRTWPLIAREEELAFIAGALRGGDGPGGIVLAGAAGVGKTRLAREALAASSRAGVVPIGIDDAHLLDQVSGSLLRALASRRGVPVIITVRSNEPTPDAITALWKGGPLARLELQALSAGETATLLTRVLGGPVDASSARWLYAATMGNVRLLRHVVDAALRSGDLRSVGGWWRWHGGAAADRELAEVVADRLRAVPADVLEVLEVLAFGEPLALAALARLVDARAIEEADRRGLVVVDPDGVCLAHPLYGEVLRSYVVHYA